jgi:hypothetical protein
MSLNTKLPMRLFSQSVHEAHPETISLGNLKVGDQPQSLIADRDASDVAVDASEADPNRPARTVGIGVPGGIRDQFGHNKREIDGPVGVDENLGRCIE